MKFKDNVYEKNCRQQLCHDCVLDLKYDRKRETCFEWAEGHPAEAARLMGYEMINDKNMGGNT